VPKRIATWNPTRGIWEDPNGSIDLLSGHSEPFSATWPISGMTRSGSAFERPTPALLMAASASSSSHMLPTPEAKLGDSGPDYARASREGSGGDDLTTTVFRQLLPTPTAQRTDSPPAGPDDPEAWEAWKQDRAERGIATGQGLLPTALRNAGILLPTPTAEIASKSTRAMTRSTENGRRSGGRQSSPLGLDETASLLNGTRPPHLPLDEDLPPASRALVAALLPTPSAMMANDQEDPDEWLERWEYHANRTDQRPTQAGMPLAISAKLLARGDHSRLRFAAGKPLSDE
jgi:hypothetical protein